jgi:hypothetical protein
VIRFSLQCDQGHAFESWFRDSASYDTQTESGLLSCPHCGSAKVEKAIMAPQVARKDRESPPVPAPAQPQPVVLMSPEEQAHRAKIRELRAMLTEKSDYVGERFANEARKMHDGEIEHRAIYGEASGEDVRSLIEDGIDIMPLPMLPDERN